VAGEHARLWIDIRFDGIDGNGRLPKADRYDPRLNRAYGELTRYYGCLVDPSRVAHPQDKPRVERGVRYARERFFRGREFTSLVEMRHAAVHWSREVAGQRIHGTTGQQPRVVFQQQEQPAVHPLPPHPWQFVHWTSAMVHADCHLQVQSVRYSVPYPYVGHRLDIRLSTHTVEIYAGSTLVTTHLRAQQGRVTRLDHYPDGAQAFLRATPEPCLAQAQLLGPATTALIRDLLDVPVRYRLREAQAVLRLAEDYGERLEAACQRAVVVGDGRYRTVRGILERGRPRGVGGKSGSAVVGTSPNMALGPSHVATST
jgi:hypothetical protein